MLWKWVDWSDEGARLAQYTFGKGWVGYLKKCLSHGIISMASPRWGCRPLTMMPFTRSVIGWICERLTRRSSASSSVTSIILKVRTMSSGGSPLCPYTSLAMEASVKLVHFPLEIIYLLVMRVMAGMVLTSLFGLYKWSSFIVGVGLITIPPLFKIYKLVLVLVSHRLQRTASSRLAILTRLLLKGS